MNAEESLSHNTQLYEYLDEIFFSISTSANRALYTLNKTSACAHLNYLANIYFPEIVFIKINDMFKPYFKKENFT